MSERIGTQEAGAGRLHVVVAPGSAVNPRTGGGQRTRLFFDACLRNGPTDLVVVGLNIDKDWVVGNFPGVRNVHVLPPVGQVVRAANQLQRKINGARLMLSPRRGYAADAGFEAALLDAIADAPEATIVFRYARTFCAAGLAAAPGRVVAVDVDDRDDQKYETYLNKALGRMATQALFAPTSIRSLSNILKARLSQATQVWFAADEDVWALPPAHSNVVPNVAMVAEMPQALPPPSQGQDILFVGSFGHGPNQAGARWFLKQCWPRVRAAVPQARVRVVGLGDWASLAPELPDPEGVDLVGPVDDLVAEYARARIAICPINEGGGSKIKVMEAAKYGRPIVIAPHSARGFNSAFVSGLHQAGDPAAFVEACVALLQNPDQADRDGAEMARLEAAHYSRDALVGRIASDLSALS